MVLVDTLLHATLVAPLDLASAYRTLVKGGAFWACYPFPAVEVIRAWKMIAKRYRERYLRKHDRYGTLLIRYFKLRRDFEGLRDIHDETVTDLHRLTAEIILIRRQQTVAIAVLQGADAHVDAPGEGADHEA